MTRSVSGEKVLLPVWHDVTKREVVDYSSSVADRVARSTATHTEVGSAANVRYLEAHDRLVGRCIAVSRTT